MWNYMMQLWKCWFYFSMNGNSFKSWTDFTQQQINPDLERALFSPFFFPLLIFFLSSQALQSCKQTWQIWPRSWIAARASPFWSTNSLSRARSSPRWETLFLTWYLISPGRLTIPFFSLGLSYFYPSVDAFHIFYLLNYAGFFLKKREKNHLGTFKHSKCRAKLPQCDSPAGELMCSQ